MKNILVSACLLGVTCRYDGKEKYSKEILELKDNYILIPVCPEIMGGLPTPRDPSEIQGDKVVTEKGQDNSQKFILGAQETLKLAKLFNIDTAILKSNSPSCGSSQIYDGSFTGTLINGQGVTTKLLRKNGIKVYSEKEISEFRKEEK